MPDANGKLDTEEKARITKWINDKWHGNNQACPICGDTNWAIADHLVMPVVTGKDNSILLGGPVYPHVMLISPTCGYTMLVNAVVIGLVEGNRTEEEQQKATAA